MLIIYPMLVSNAVSENIIPGIVKTAEAFIIIDSKNTIIDNSNINRKYKIKLKSGRLTMRENASLIKEEDDDIPYDSMDDWQNYKDQDRFKRKEKFAKDQEKRIDKERKKEKEEAKEEAKDKYNKEQERKKDEDEKEERKEIRDLAKEKRKEKQDLEKEKRKEKQELAKEKRKEKERLIKKAEDDKEKEDERIRKAKTTVKISDNRAISIEPSTAEIDVLDRYGNTKQEFLGIKVLPIRVRSDTKLSRLILHDIQISKINSMIISVGRSILKKVYNFSKFWRAKTLSGDPRRDIIMGRSGHKGQGFIVLSKTEDIDETFMSNISKLNRLFKLGWGNVIIVDDIKRQAHFCMKRFKGVCVTLSFSTIYQNLGHLGVYEDLEDAKKKTNMVFKTKSNFKKLFAEYKTQYKISKYLNERN